jgi:hypothetical protein
MAKKMSFLVLAASLCCGAAPTSQPVLFDRGMGERFALAMAGICTHEDHLLKEAGDPSLAPPLRGFAAVAAIINEWRGPFRIHEFAAWLRKNGLAGQIRAAEVEGNMQRFKHLPDDLSQVCLSIGRRPDGDCFAEVYMAVPGNVSAEDIQAIIDNPKEDGTGRTPIAYSLDTHGFPGTYPGMVAQSDEDQK